MTFKKKLLLMSLAMFLLPGCDFTKPDPSDDLDDDTPSVEPTDNTKVQSISFDNKIYSINVGESINLSVNVSPSTAINKDVTFSLTGNDNNTIALVDSNRIIGISEGEVIVNAVSKDNSNAKDTATVKVLKEDDEEQKEETNPYLINEKSESFDLFNNEYTAKGDYSYHIFPTELSNGLIEVNVSCITSENDLGLIVGYKENDNTYYRVGINKNSKLEISYFNGENIVRIKEFSTLFNNESLKLSLKLFSEYDYISIKVNNEEFIQNVELPADSHCGIFSEIGGAKFSNLKMNKNPYIDDFNKEHFKLAHGKADITDNNIVVKAASTLVMSNKKLYDGAFEFSYLAKGNNSLVGCVFCVDNAGRDTFWAEKDVAYYRLGVGITGSLNLYKVVNGTTTILRYFIPHMYDDAVEHTIKVIKNGQIFDFYLDGEFQMSHRDDNLLEGAGVGVFTGFNTGYFKNIKVNNVDYISPTKLPKMRICSGSFESTYSAIRSTSKNSLCLMDEEMTTREGSIETTIGGGTSELKADGSYGYKFGYGIVFNVTTPNMKNFYESQIGLSYYCFWNDGDQYFRLGRFEGTKVVWTTKRYVAQSIEHSGNVRIVVKGNDIYCYYLNRLIVKYHDNNPLQGKKFGFKANDIDAVFDGGMKYSEDTSLDKAEYLIFGHSYTHLWLNYKKDFAELGDDVLDVGIGGANTRHFKEYINEIANYEPKWGIYWNGINDINGGVIQTTEMAQNVKTVMEGIKAILPEFKCVVIGVNFCTHGKSVENRNLIIEANLKYKEMCDTLDYVKFLDVQELYSDGNGQPVKSYFIDDLHPTKEAYQMVAPLIINLIKEK